MMLPDKHLRRAWLALTATLGIHVLDEAVHDFLSVYNPQARAIREHLGIPFPPIFTWRLWWAGLGAALLLLTFIGCCAVGRRPSMRIVAAGYAVLMLANAAGHFAGSLYWKRWMPGVYSSPLLLAAAIWLLVEVRRTAARWNDTHPESG
jgi:hypothetical protein